MVRPFQLNGLNSKQQVIQQGSQTQIHQGATFGWKMSLRATVLNKKGSAGAGRSVEKYVLSNIVALKETHGPHCNTFGGPRVRDPCSTECQRFG